VRGTGRLFLLPPGLWLLGRGALGFADLLLGLMLAVGYAMPLDRLLRFGSKLREVEEWLRLIDDLLDRPPLPEPEHPCSPATHGIEYDGVVFGYRQETPLFSGLSIHGAGNRRIRLGPSARAKQPPPAGGPLPGRAGGRVRSRVDVRSIATSRSRT
jgi:ATP-binding cassette subfamily B protein